jgi:hypothetical protein
MNQFIESMRRLYSARKVNDAQLEKMLTSKKITKEEYNYIISKDKEVQYVHDFD